MTKFDEAAMGAAEEIEPKIDKLLASLCDSLKSIGALPQNICVDTYNKDSADTIRYLSAIIAQHFAEIEAVFGKLVELAKTYGWDDDFDKIARIQELLADPQVKAAIERSKE